MATTGRSSRSKTKPEKGAKLPQSPSSNSESDESQRARSEAKTRSQSETTSQRNEESGTDEEEQEMVVSTPTPSKHGGGKGRKAAEKKVKLAKTAATTQKSRSKGKEKEVVESVEGCESGEEDDEAEDKAPDSSKKKRRRNETAGASGGSSSRPPKIRKASTKANDATVTPSPSKDETKAVVDETWKSIITKGSGNSSKLLNKAAVARQIQKTIPGWQLGIDRDGGDDPSKWKFYDPDVVPKITQSTFHDSAGIHGLPANVILGERAVVRVLNCGISLNNRNKLWPGNFITSGWMNSNHAHRGKPALSPDGKYWAIDHRGEDYVFYGSDEVKVTDKNTTRLEPRNSEQIGDGLDPLLLEDSAKNDIGELKKSTNDGKTEVKHEREGSVASKLSGSRSGASRFKFSRVGDVDNAKLSPATASTALEGVVLDKDEVLDKIELRLKSARRGVKFVSAVAIRNLQELNAALVTTQYLQSLLSTICKKVADFKSAADNNEDGLDDMLADLDKSIRSEDGTYLADGIAQSLSLNGFWLDRKLPEILDAHPELKEVLVPDHSSAFIDVNSIAQRYLTKLPDNFKIEQLPTLTEEQRIFELSQESPPEKPEKSEKPKLPLLERLKGVRKENQKGTVKERNDATRKDTRGALKDTSKKGDKRE
ncbi:hypothetical protein ONS95_004702 [Cadophora gregata]|uniref:uncharacterized protein n=1 Tax=Cadophora gregata TaxID=51156 RepID=UPI0026DC792B|nr:uncharacterized protein ONS95_004702 [Cadophora gregata]KAK0104408.1 hypothetical protein ONS95_004702 [Cadophora gregata]KAK0115496.1 hypothetical protein ONS96_013950 [Cadophora gregata f. sp. sojae]